MSVVWLAQTTVVSLSVSCRASTGCSGAALLGRFHQYFIRGVDMLYGYKKMICPDANSIRDLTDAANKLFTVVSGFNMSIEDKCAEF